MDQCHKSYLPGKWSNYGYIDGHIRHFDSTTEIEIS